MVEDALVSADVEAAQRLIELLDEEGLEPRAALWVFSPDHGRWRLWLVPRADGRGVQIREVYMRISRVISKNRDEMQNIDIGDIDILEEKHEAIKELSKLFRIDGIGRVHISNNKLNNIFIPEAIILRLAL